MQAIGSLSSSAKAIVGNIRALVVFFVVYLALIGAVGLFSLGNVATVSAVFLMFTYIFLAPVVFFLLQTMCVSFSVNVEAKVWLKDSVKKFWKLILVSLPIIVLAILTYRLFALAVNENTFIATVRFLLFAYIFPLTLIHLWIDSLGNDFVSTYKNFKAILAKAFAPISVLIYFIGLIVFAFIPFLLLSPQIKLQQSNVVIGLLIVRVIVAFLFVFIGWIVTVNALSRITETR